MSTTGRVIDNSVVQFEFDNRNFERNAQTTMNTLDKLKSSLNFNSAIAGLNNLASSVGEVNFDGLASSIETVHAKFSAWEVIAISALNKITSQVVDLGEKFVKSMSIDQITAGWSKYESKISSIQTIMSATESTWKKNAEAIGFEGTQMEYVTEQLEKLNWFSDETSYSFTDMTSNIGKFTSSGVALNEAVTAMEGISVWAAKSGQNTQSASRAMYNLAQAISVGSVKLIDWKSIENANMATIEFKQTAIDTAVQLKYLKKVGDGVYKTTSGSTVSVENFNEALKDEWFSSEVLMETLNKYGKAATRLSEISEEYDVTATSFLAGLKKYNEGTEDLTKISENLQIPAEELIPLFDELNSKEYQLGLSAFKAAQEAKTFTEAIDATKDAVSTGWMKTFDLIFGNYEEAKVIWTELTERLWDVFAAGGDARNAVLKLWASGDGRDTLISSFWELWDTVDAFAEIVREAFGEIFPHDIESTAQKLIGLTKRFQNFVKGLALSEETADKLKTVFKGIFSFLDILKDSLQVVTIPLKTIFDLLSSGSSVVLDYAESVGQWLINLRHFLQVTNTFENAGKAISNAILRIIEVFKYYQNMVGESLSKGNSGIATAFMVISDILSKIVGGIILSFEKLTGFDISKVINDISENMKGLSDYFKEVAKGLTLQKIVDRISSFIKDIRAKISEFKVIDITPIGELFNKIYDDFDPVNRIFDAIRFIFETFFDFLRNFAPMIKRVAGFIGNVFMEIGGAIYEGLANSNFESLYQIVKSGSLAAISAGITGFITSITNVTKGVGDITDGLADILGAVKDTFVAWQNDIKSNILLKIAAAITLITGSVLVLSGIDSQKLSDALGAITVEFINLIGSMSLLSKLNLVRLSMTANVFTTLSTAILILSAALKMISSIEDTKLVSSIAGIAALSFMLVKVAESLSARSAKMITGVGSLVLFAVAIRMLVKPVKELGLMNFADMLKGLTGVLILIEGISLFLQDTDMSGKIFSASVSIIAIATGVLILSKAVKNFAQLDFVELVKGLSAFGLTLYGLSQFMNSIYGIDKMISTSIAMTIMGAAMLIFASAIQKMGSMPVYEIAKGLATMAIALAAIVVAFERMPADVLRSAAGLTIASVGILMLAEALTKMGSIPIHEIGKALLTLFLSLVTISAALRAMEGTIGGAGAMVVMAAAINLLVPALYALGKLSLKEIAKSLLTLVGVFAILGYGSSMLAGLVPAMLSVAGAFAVFGAAALALGVGLVLISAGLSAFSVSIGAALGGIILVIKAVVDLIPDIAKTIVKSVLEILTMFLNEASKFISAIVDFVTTLIESVLDAVHRLTPRIVQFLRTDLVRIVDALLSSAKQLIPKIIDFLYSLLDQISDVADKLTGKVIDIALKVIGGITGKLPEILDTLVSFIIDLINGLANAIKTNTGPLLDAVDNLLTTVFEFVLQFFGFSNEEAEKFVSLGKNLLSSLTTGLSYGLTWVLEGFSNIIDEVKFLLDPWIEDFKELGKRVIDGLIEGIKSMADPLKNAFISMAGLGSTAFANNLQIKSPSRVFEKYGVYIDEGLIKGIDKLSGQVGDSGKYLSNTLISEIEDPIQGLIDMMEDPNYSPRITPVLDLDSFNSQYSGINDIVSKSTIDAAGYNQNAINYNLTKKFDQNVQTTSPDVVNAVNGLKQDIVNLGQKISNLYVQLDTGVMVGALTPSINQTMGKMAIQKARGN